MLSDENIITETKRQQYQTEVTSCSLKVSHAPLIKKFYYTNP